MDMSIHGMKKFSLSLLMTIFVLCCFDLSFISGQDLLTGNDIAQKLYERDRGKSSVSKATMVLEDKKGNTRSRTFILQRILSDNLEKRLLRFTSPADINGTGFLVIEKSGDETEQFLYLPALRRTRRIVSSQKSHKFVNSDFTYEDMERRTVENYIHDIRGETTIDGIDCYILETRPKKNADSQYSLIRSYISKDSFVSLFTEYFDQKETLLKTYRVLELEKIQEKWTETSIIMEDAGSHHKTQIKLEYINYDTGITPDQISKAALEDF